jgi:hypothetical protein
LRRRIVGFTTFVAVGGDTLASGGGTGETLELLESLSIGDGDGESQYTIVRSGNIPSI